MITHSVNDWVTCTNNEDHNLPLTVGKDYHVKATEFDKIVIIDDSGKRDEYYAFRFVYNGHQVL